MVEDNNQMTMDDLDQLINDNPPGNPPPEPADNSATAESQGTTDTGTSETTEGTTDNSANTAPTTESNNKANAAFAEMRIQNRKITDALAAVLQQHGLDPALAKNPEQLIKDAEDARLEAEAKKQQVPADLLKRLTQLEKANLENERTRLTNAALAGFQAVKQKYNLSNQDISAFARQLQEAGTNPFEQEMDLEQHYKLHNLDKIIAAETQRAVEEALRNQQSATQYSTAPSTTQGKKESSGADTIDTMAQFDRFLMSLNK